MRGTLIGCMFLSILLAGCASTPAPLPSARSTGNFATDNLNAVAWTQRAIEHDLIFTEVYRSARVQLPIALADPDWDALPRDERDGPLEGLAPAVILDIDETVLDNSPYQAGLIRIGEAYAETTWAAWVNQASARALPGALEFTNFAAEHGVTVFYISNRADELQAATLANLRSLGFPVASDDVFLGLGRLLDGCEPRGSEKGCRRMLVGEEYRVLMQFGDQIGDFVDVDANTLRGRRQAMAPYGDWIGRRWFVLPNPTYGSWEPALFNNDWSQTPEQRHQLKIDALRFE